MNEYFDFQLNEDAGPIFSLLFRCTHRLGVLCPSLAGLVRKAASRHAFRHNNSFSFGGLLFALLRARFGRATCLITLVLRKLLGWIVAGGLFVN
jgi:hypothetical protein